MENHIGLKNNLKPLKSFIIRRFIILLVFIAVEERIVYLLYNYVIFPFLKEILGQNKVDFQYTKNGMLLGVALYLILMLIQCIIDIMPPAIAIPFKFLFGKATELLNVDTEILVFNQKIPDNMYVWFRIVSIAIIILLLAIAVFPYVISIVIYCQPANYNSNLL